MEDKIAKELITQLKRIADALETSNKNSDTSEKRKVILDKLQEKNLRADLREKLNIDIDPEKVIHTSPRLESDGSV
jgi:hypothetical protein